MLYHYLETVPPAGNLASVPHSFALSAFAFPAQDRNYYQYSAKKKNITAKADAMGSHSSNNLE